MDLGPVPLDPKYQGFILIIVCAICLPLLLSCVILRLYMRIWVPRSIAWDDGKTINVQELDYTNWC